MALAAAMATLMGWAVLSASPRRASTQVAPSEAVTDSVDPDLSPWSEPLPELMPVDSRLPPAPSRARVVPAAARRVDVVGGASRRRR